MICLHVPVHADGCIFQQYRGEISFKGLGQVIFGNSRCFAFLV